MISTTHWLSAVLILGACGVLITASALRNARLRRGQTGPAIATAHACMDALHRQGWLPAGAGPNYIAVYLNKDELQIALTVTVEDPVTPNVLREMVADFRNADFSAGRRWVGVFHGGLAYGVLEAAARQGITLVRFAELDTLEGALTATLQAAATGRDAEIRALTRAYDPPMAAPMRPAAAEGGLILETDLVACFMRDRGGDDLLITFANQWLQHDGRAFWADSVSAALSLSVIGFVAKEPCWYPPDDMAALVPAVLQRIDERFSKRILYGNSQGGYAAIKFSAALGATTVLAFSPQYSIDRRIVPDDRVNKYYTGQRNAGMWVQADEAAGNIFVFYDPQDSADAAHAVRIAQAACIIPIQIPYVGHSSDRGMSHPERFAGLLAAAATGDGAAMRQFLARERRVRVDRSVLMALGLSASKPRIAAAILEKYAGSWKPDQVASVCFRIAAAGQPARALAPAVAAAQDAPGNANVQGAAGLIALQARRLDLAEGLIARALELEPYSPKWANAAQRLRGLALAESAGVGR